VSAEEPKIEAWYASDGPENDVIVSSRVRVARNLAGFPFPDALRSDDAERVLSIILDSFNHLENPDRYQIVRMSDLDLQGRRILAERGVIRSGTGSEPWRGVAIRADGAMSATINMSDHLRLASFAPGLALEACAANAFSVDAAMQRRVQFAASPSFGYLTSNLLDSGTGVKASVLACLPALCLSGLLDRAIRDLLAKGCSIRGYYGSDDAASLGCLYQVSNASASAGDAASQIASMERIALNLAALERKSREDLLANVPVTVEDTVFRAIVVAKYARFLPFREAVDLLQRIRLGVNLSLVTGIGNRELSALLYRIQNAHVTFVISGGSVIIEDDVRTEEMRMDRLRAMVVQEVLKDADIRERRQ
jgi:protein arginine kinase